MCILRPDLFFFLSLLEKKVCADDSSVANSVQGREIRTHLQFLPPPRKESDILKASKTFKSWGKKLIFKPPPSPFSGRQYDLCSRNV